MDKKKWEQENVLRLVKKSRKGVLRVVFSRFGLMALLLILELVLLWMMWRWFNNDFEWFAAVQGVFTVLMFFHLFNSDMDATGKLTWMFLLAVIPIPASIFLWFTEKDVGHRTLKRRVQQRIDESRDLLHQDPEVLRDPEIESSGTDDLCRYLNRSGSFPLYANTETKFFPQGEDKFAALLEELQKAEKFIFLEYFIIDEGYMWGSILKILADKAAQGVDVRVLYDGMLEISTLPWDYPRRLEKLGIRCKAFAPIQPFLSTHYNYRDHRKILVIDGKVAFTGGVNLADEYINRKERFGHWKDTAILLRGEAVQSFTLMFLQMWNLTEKEPRWDEALLPSPPVEAEGYVMPYCDCPLDDYKVGRASIWTFSTGPKTMYIS
ncbi:MAG: phospholipase D-like domain-containing protein [Oscillospiraceae bacterium]